MDLIRFNPIENSAIKMGLNEVTEMETSMLRVYRDILEKEKVDSKFFNVLVVTEPRCVMPWQYREEVLEKFNLVVTFGPWRADNLGVEKWVWQPYDWKSLKPEVGFRRERSIVLVNSNKFGVGNSSLYGLRRETIQLFDSNKIDLTVFGHNWAMPIALELRKRFYSFRKSIRYGQKKAFTESFSHFTMTPRNYLGQCRDKIRTISKFEYSLVIENDLDSLTEKLFDAITAQTIPIYIGPNLREFEFLESCVIRSKPNSAAILETFQEITPDDVKRVRHGMKQIHRNSEQISEWKTSSVMKRLGRIIGESWGLRANNVFN